MSRALNDNPLIKKKTRNNIQEVAKALGYRHNMFVSNLRNQKTNTIGVPVHDLNGNFIASVLAGIEKVTTEAGYDLLSLTPTKVTRKKLNNSLNLFHKRVDGMIASLAFATDKLDHFHTFEERGIPIIFFARGDEKSDYTKVIIDNYKFGYNTTQHLIQQGYKRIVLVTGTLTYRIKLNAVSSLEVNFKFVGTYLA